MSEIIVESKTYVTENGRTVLCEKRYRGVLEEGGNFRLLACFGKRMLLTEAQAAHLCKSENILKEVAHAA